MQFRASRTSSSQLFEVEPSTGEGGVTSGIVRLTVASDFGLGLKHNWYMSACMYVCMCAASTGQSIPCQVF